MVVVEVLHLLQLQQEGPGTGRHGRLECVIVLPFLCVCVCLYRERGPTEDKERGRGAGGGACLTAGGNVF